MKGSELKEYIINNNKVFDILEAIGMHKIVDRGNYISCAFPPDETHDGDNPNGCLIYPSLKIKAQTRKIESNVCSMPDIFDLISFVTHKSGIGLAMSILGLSTNQSITTVKPKLDGTEIFKKVKNKKKTTECENYLDESILDRYMKICHIDLLKKDGILPDVALEWELGIDEDSERITFPHRHWNNGKLLAIVGRTLIKEYEALKIPKYLTIAGVGYKKERNLYGLYKNKKDILDTKTVILVEGEKSVIKLWQWGYRNAVSVGCHAITPKQISILSILGLNEIVVCWDSDVETEYTYETCEKLKGVANKISYIDVSKIKLYDGKNAPVDKGLKRWRLLYNRRSEYGKDVLVDE